MGNQISGIAPSQILPVENYVIDLNNRILKQLAFHKSLGSTRFLKVVMCLSDRGPVVVKIFVIQDHSLNLTQQKTKVKVIAEKLSGAVNCLPYDRVEITDKAAFIMRQYMKSSLYDRISTRPFLSLIEKKWLAFQLLCALQQCHNEQICHGDIKLENLLVTSWSWLVLSDFASYKPVLLPEDNPTDFTYYFDTARRRVCYIAPERFIKVVQREDDQELQSGLEGVRLTPEMDIFSAGCVLTELFTEGFYPFNLMQLLQYRAGSYYPDRILEGITDARVKRMVENMIRKCPSDRPSAASILEEEKGFLFPEYFYSVLWPFCREFAASKSLTADEKVQKIQSTLPDILENLLLQESETPVSSSGSEGIPTETATSETVPKCVEKSEESETDLCCEAEQTLFILSSLLTSCVRALFFSSSKLKTLKQFRLLSKRAPSEVILDRILPYIINLIKDPDPSVRAEALFSLTFCLSRVRYVPRSEVNVFLEYILPNLNDITQDGIVVVRQAEAASIAAVADAASRFVEFCERTWPFLNRQNELQTVQEIVQQKLAKLFSDPSNAVKRTLIEETINALCAFFGKEKANDVLLSHMITFLNEKDPHLRISFYRNVTGIAAFMGTSCNPILKPLLLQGLCDTEETVTIAAIETMSSLTEIGIFPDHCLIELTNDVAPLLLHPNSWIRLAVVGFVAAVSKSLPFLDVQTSVAIALKPYLKDSILQYNDETCLLSCLREPLHRGIFDVLVRCADVGLVLNVLKEASASESDVAALPASLGEGSQPVKNVMKRLLAAGLSNALLPSIFSLEDHLVKVHRHRKILETLQMSREVKPSGTYTFLNAYDQLTLVHRFRLSTKEVTIELSSNNSRSSSVVPLKSGSVAMNEEWQTMFGGGGPVTEEELRSSGSTQASFKQTGSSLGTSFSSQAFTVEHSSMDMTSSIVPNCFLRCPEDGPPCQRDLENLLKVKREELMVSVQSRKVMADSNGSKTTSIKKWRPKGHLVAHLHEHRAAITRLTTMKGTTLFATSSKDGSFKVWDANKTERTFPVNRSKFTYAGQCGSMNSVAHCGVHESLACSFDDGSVHVVRLERQSCVAKRDLDKETDGYALDVEYMDAGVHSLLTYSTVYGRIVGWDLRSPGVAWALDNGVKKGVITSYAIDAANNWLACGTSSGAVVCWDLRFTLPISQVNHPHGHAVQRVKIHPTTPSGVISSFRANNEIVIWDMETQSRAKTLWASPNPPFSEKLSRKRGPPVLDNWVHGLIGCVGESGAVSVAAGGTDSRIRLWDLDRPEASYVVSQPAIHGASSCGFHYGSRVIDGSEVIVESMSTNSGPATAGDEAPKRSLDHTPPGHVETITDLGVIERPQRMLVSCGFDGVVKMWK